MKKKCNAKISILLGIILLTFAQLSVECAGVPVPQNSQIQVWDNFNINSSFSSASQPLTKEEKQESPSVPQYKSEPIAEQIQVPQQSTAMTQDKIDALNDLRNQAKLLYNANKSNEALTVFNQIPDSEKVSDDWLYIANIAQDTGKDMDAVFYLKKAIQVDDNNYKAHYNLGNLYLSDGKTNMAISEYQKSIKIKKDFAYAHYNKGCAYLQKENWYNAKYEFAQAIKINPEEPSFYYNLAYTYKMLNKEKKANDALEIYDTLMQK